MPITTLQTATAGSVSALVTVVKANIAALSYPYGGLKGVQATVGRRTEYFQMVAVGGVVATDYDVVISQDRAEFTNKMNAKIAAGFQPIGDMSVIQVTPGRTCEYAQAFTKP